MTVTPTKARPRWSWLPLVLVGACAARTPPPVAPVTVPLDGIALQAHIAGERLTVARPGCASAACALELTRGVWSARARVSAAPMVGTNGLIAVVLTQTYDADLGTRTTSRTFLVDPGTGAPPALVCELPSSSHGSSCISTYRTSTWATVERASPLRMRVMTTSDTGDNVEAPTCACFEATPEGCRVTGGGPVTCADDALKVTGREPGPTGLVASAGPGTTVVAIPRGGGPQTSELAAEDGGAHLALPAGRYDVVVITDAAMLKVEAEVVAGQTTRLAFDPRACSCCPAP